MFQLEVNKAWSDKDAVLYVWLRYNSGEYITPTMAEATAIMPLMSGAKGLWLWDHYYPGEADDALLTNYDYFIRGLQRLSEYNAYFNSDYEVYIPETAHALFLSGNPVWRAVVNGPNILVAAQNPFADEAEVTTMTVEYMGWSQQIALIGNQVFLCDFVWNPDAVKPYNYNSNISVFPNPVESTLNIHVSGTGENEIHFYNGSGQHIHQTSFVKETQIDTSEWPCGLYFYFLAVENASGSVVMIK